MHCTFAALVASERIAGAVVRKQGKIDIFGSDGGSR